jgi:solute carrier family 25 (mitochondrial iron transporter), member 28/37
MKLIFERGGALGFTKGMSPRVLVSIPSTAICWSVYQFFKEFLYRYRIGGVDIKGD